MHSDFTNEKTNYTKSIKLLYAYCGGNRELLVDEIIRIGILAIDGTPIVGSKERIYELYESQSLSQKTFGQKLNALFAPTGYSPVNLPIDDHTPYKPFNLVYNNAGLQFMFRDKIDNIHIECIEWSEVARRIGRMIQRNEYFSDESLGILRKNRERSER